MNCDNIGNECACTYSSCANHAKCCECLRYHRSKGELPGCYFPKEAEKTYNRSIAYFVDLYNSGKI